MTEENSNLGALGTSEKPLNAVDLTAAENDFIVKNGADFTEVKEAMVDALLRLTEQRCSGEGTDGEVIYGVRPSTKLVSGFLLPRYDQSGQEDETSDLHISTMGVDLQVRADVPGEVVVHPRLAVYLRELPSWQDISDPTNEMMPQIHLSRETRQAVEKLARAYIQERTATLPPLPDDEGDQERAGEAIARAEAAHEASEVSQEMRSETRANDGDAIGTARAKAAGAKRAERAAIAHEQQRKQRNAASRERVEAISAIRREAFDLAFAELGIRLVNSDNESTSAYALTSDHFEEGAGSKIIEAGKEDAEALSLRESLRWRDPEETEEGSITATGAAQVLRLEAGRIDDKYAAPQPIPQKWRRFKLDLGELRFEIPGPETRATAVDRFEQQFQSALNEAIANWLATETGQQNSYRPDERILPSNFADENAWNRFLSDLRKRRPATPADVRPDLKGVKLVIELDPDFVDASRLNLRISIQNDAAMPAGRNASAYEHAVFQVTLEIKVAENIHLPLLLDRVEPSYRFRHWLEYAAMGLNCGIEQGDPLNDFVSLKTTWAPALYSATN